MRHRLHRLAIFFAFALAILGQVSSLPTPAGSSTDTFYRRQAQGSPVSQSIVTQTVQTIQTDAGPVVETCTITFTPVNGPNGESLIQVVRQCTITAASQSASTSSTASTFTTSLPPSTTTESTSTTTSASSSVPFAVFSSIPLSSITIGSSSSSFTPTPSSSVAPTSEVTATSTSDSGTSAADSATASASSSAAAAFQIPGKKISVLPIGLGIFAGISVIALIVVGLVTYERTKYRKIFRQRKLAEQGAGPGYGGLA